MSEPSGLQYKLTLFCRYATKYIIMYTLIFPFFRLVKGILSQLNIMLIPIISVFLISFKDLSAVEQLFHIFLFILSSILLNTGSCLVSILNRFNSKMSFSTQCIILPFNFLAFSNFSSPLNSLDKEFPCKCVFSFTSIMPQSNAII